MYNAYAMQRWDRPVAQAPEYSASHAAIRAHPLLRHPARSRATPSFSLKSPATSAVCAPTADFKPFSSRDAYVHGASAGQPPDVSVQQDLNETLLGNTITQAVRQAVHDYEWHGLRSWRAKGRDLRLRWSPLLSDVAASAASKPTHSASRKGQAPASVPASASASAPAAPPAQAQTQAPAPPGGPQCLPRHEAPTLASAVPPGQAPPASLVEAGLLVLRTACPYGKAAITHAAWGEYLEGRLPLRPGEEGSGRTDGGGASSGDSSAGTARAAGQLDSRLATDRDGSQQARESDERTAQPQQQQQQHCQHEAEEALWQHAVLEPGTQRAQGPAQQQGQGQGQGQGWGSGVQADHNQCQVQLPGCANEREQQRGEQPGQQQHQQGQQREQVPGRSAAGGRAPAGPSLEELLPAHPARPERPRLVRPKEIPGHESSPLGLNGYMLHNMAHIELNAIDLAWDTVVRFSHLGLPGQFYEDFARVADDESRHLGWCLQRLGELGHRYGDMDAHDLLWQGCHMSAGDLGARLAVVPMSQEARGLDAGGRLVQRLVGFGDPRSAAVVGLIAEEERAHVAVGVTWFTRICAALGLQAGPLYRRWLLHLNPDLLKGPFNHPERNLVGLQRDWYDPVAWDQPSPDTHHQQHHHDDKTNAEQKRPRDACGPAASASASASAAAAAVAAAAAAPPVPPPRASHRRSVPLRGSPCPRLEGPQPRLSEDQLALLAERLAAFAEVEGAAAGSG